MLDIANLNCRVRSTMLPWRLHADTQEAGVLPEVHKCNIFNLFFVLMVLRIWKVPKAATDEETGRGRRGLRASCCCPRRRQSDSSLGKLSSFRLEFTFLSWVICKVVSSYELDLCDGAEGGTWPFVKTLRHFQGSWYVCVVAIMKIDFSRWRLEGCPSKLTSHLAVRLDFRSLSAHCPKRATRTDQTPGLVEVYAKDYLRHLYKVDNPSTDLHFCSSIRTTTKSTIHLPSCILRLSIRTTEYC